MSLQHPYDKPENAQVLALRNEINAAFARIAAEFTADDVTVVMPTYSPPQGRLLSEFNRVGGKAVIAGGKHDMPAFANVPQYGQDFDTSAYLNTFPVGMSAKIVGALPAEVLQDKKIALFSFIPEPNLWSSFVQDRDLDTRIYASNEQNTRLFFENKGNLMHILDEAGLSAYVIPTEVVRVNVSEQELRDIYHRNKNPNNGKVVVQACVENYEPTQFISSEDEFVTRIKGAKVPFKVSRFIEGNEGNLSFFCTNVLPAAKGRGVEKCNLPANIDLTDPANLAAIEAHAAKHGINATNVFSVTGRATLKVVGDPLLANEPGDSVGNNIGHVYEGAVAAQIAEIGDKLGRKLALCGKVGHAGADLIIDRSGKVWINEINDRQQGPTDQMSADAEAAGIPGLSRMAWFAHFADFTQESNMSALQQLRAHADAIRDGYMTSAGSFYVKVFATHGPSYDHVVTAQTDLPSGLYTVRNEKGGWVWEKAGPGAELKPVDLDSGVITVKISSGSLKKGDQPLCGSEMFRITGIASGDDAPFVIRDGVSCLNPRWRPLIEKLYADCFGADYVTKNPQYAKPSAKAAALKVS